MAKKRKTSSKNDKNEMTAKQRQRAASRSHKGKKAKSWAVDYSRRQFDTTKGRYTTAGQAYNRSLPKGADRAERVQRSRGKTKMNLGSGTPTYNFTGQEYISPRNQAAGLRRVAPYKDPTWKADKARKQRERRGDAGSRRRSSR